MEIIDVRAGSNPVLTTIINKQNAMKTIQISEEKAKELYKTASPEFRAMLEETFGNGFFVSIETVEEAMKYLGISNNYVVRLDERYFERLQAFYELSVLCEAWNKQDSFVPDFNDKNQDKWYPIFSFAGCSFSYSINSPSSASAYIGSQLCFKSKQRSSEFGKKYEYLFKIFLRG